MVDTQTGGPTVIWPEIVDVRNGPSSADERTAVLAIRIPERLAYFAGHFDELPVVPGVVQIQWAVHYARQYLDIGGDFSHMDVVKFKELLLPGQFLELNLCYREGLGRLKFSYRSESAEYSSGSLYFHDPAI